MPDFNDKELDKLFQEAADQIRPEFDTQDWEQLSARLDQHDDKGIFYRSASLYGIVILLLIFNVRNVWKEYYRKGSTPGIITLDAPHQNNNPINSNKHIKADSIASQAKSKILLENDSAEIESKSNVAPFISLQEQNHSGKIINQPDVGKVSSVHKFRSKESHLQNETGKENNQDLRKDNGHIATDGDAVDNTGKIVHEKNRDINQDDKRSLLNKDNKNVPATGSMTSLDKNDSIKNNNTQTSESNKNKETGALAANRRSTDVLHSEAIPDPIDDAHVNDLNNKQERDSLKSDKQGVDDSNSMMTFAKEYNTQVYSVNKEADKQRPSFNHSEQAHNKKDSTPVSDLNKNKDVGLMNKDEQSKIITHASVTLNKGDSTLINDSTKVQKDRHTKLVKGTCEDSSSVQSGLTKTRYLFIKLPISPDFSSVKNESIGGPGINAGLLVEYNINKHIAFETGVIWSKKIYDAHYAKVNFVEGDCRILDIPINIKYYLLPYSRINFFANVGFSSYVMLKEKYDYTVVTPNNGERRWSQEYSRKNNEWFSMLNLSIGIQRQMSKRVWLQAEPFFKAPIAGVGVGNIRLASMGAFLTLKYKIK